MNQMSMFPLRNENVSLSTHWPLLTPQECARIVTQANAAAWTSKLPLGPGNFPVFPDGKENKGTEYQRLPLGKNAYPLDQINFGLCQVNSDGWRFELAGIPADDMPLLVRQKKSKDPVQDWQVDLGDAFTASRKLCFILQLSDPKTYEGGDIVLHNVPRNEDGYRAQGTLIVFPAYWLHKVSNVTKGTRHSIMGWVHGNSFK